MSRGGGVATSSTEVTSKTSSNKWFGLAALAVVGLIGWSLTSGSSDGSDINGDAGIEEAEAEAQAENAPASKEDPTVVEEVFEFEVTTTEGAAEETTSLDTTGSAESNPSDERAEESELVLLTESGEVAVFEEPFGFAVLLSGNGSRMRVFDPSTSRLIELKGLNGDIALLTATHLVIRSTNSGTLSSTGLHELSVPQQDRVRLDGGAGGGWFSVSAGPSAGQAWLFDQGFGPSQDEPLRNLVDLASGDSIRSHVLASPISVIEGAPGDVVNVRGGGVFVEDGDGQFRRFSEGWALGANSDLILVRRCASDLSCRSLWLNRKSGATIDLPALDLPNFDFWSVIVDPTSSWAWSRTPSGGVLFEIETGLRIEMPEIEAWPGPGFSPDGRWIVYVSQPSGELNIVNFFTGEVFHSSVPVRTTGQANFVPLTVMNQFPQDG